MTEDILKLSNEVIYQARGEYFNFLEEWQRLSEELKTLGVLEKEIYPKLAPCPHATLLPFNNYITRFHITIFTAQALSSGCKESGQAIG